MHRIHTPKTNVFAIISLITLMVGTLYTPVVAYAASSCASSIAPSPAVAAQTISQAYQAWKASYVTGDGADGQLRVQRSSSNNYDTVSEGIGYGMLFAAANNDPTTFAKLWAYEQAHLDPNGLMNWDIASDGSTIGSNAATDADEDMAIALVMADKEWSGYTAAATNQINLIGQYEIEAGSYVVKPGDVWGGSQLLNPSYFAPAYYNVFQSYTGNSMWGNVTTETYTVLNAIKANPAADSNGFVPDWTTADGGQVSGMSYEFGYDASRAPIRLAMSGEWTCDTNAAAALQPITTQFQTIGSDNIVAGYTLEGSPQDLNDNNVPLVAAAAAAATVSADNNYRTSAWNALVNIPLSSYFPDSMRLLGLLVASNSLTNPLQIAPATSNAVTTAAVLSDSVASNANTSATIAAISNTPASPSKIDIWWPGYGTSISGTQPFKAMLEGLNVSYYSMYWQVDGGQLNTMSSNDDGYPHKQSDVDVSGWKWHGDGPYTVTFVAVANNGELLGSASTTISVKH